MNMFPFWDPWEGGQFYKYGKGLILILSHMRIQLTICLYLLFYACILYIYSIHIFHIYIYMKSWIGCRHLGSLRI